MKKSLWIVLLLALVCTLALSACDDTNQPQTPNEDHVHAFSEWTTVKDSTCTVKGEQERTCSCGEKETKSIDATGHTEVIDAAVDPACNATGLTEGKHCSVCNETIVAQEVVAKLEHTHATDAAVEATCSATGLTEGSHCSVCNAVITAQQVVAKKEHTTSDWLTDTEATCSVAGAKHKECTVCHTVLESGSIDKVAHTPATDAAVEATCSATGLTEGSHCSVCKTILVKQEIVEITHNYTAVHEEDFMLKHGFDKYACQECSSTTYIDYLGEELEISNFVLSSDNTTIMSFTNKYTADLLVVPETVTRCISDEVFFDTSLRYILWEGLNLDLYLQSAKIKNIYIPFDKNIKLTYCYELDTVIWEEGVTKVGNHYAEYSSQLDRSLHGSYVKNIVIPISIKSINGHTFYETSKLENVFYMGTEEDWNKIDIDENYNLYFIYATRYFYSETQPIESGNYWHYVDGVPTPW